MWILSDEGNKVVEGTYSKVLSAVSDLDPFVSFLTDGMKVKNYVVTEHEPVAKQRTEDEKRLRSFTSTLHKQIHDADEAAYRGEANKANDLLVTIKDRLDHYMKRVSS